jgi:NAD(P)H-hydrate epimerase
MKVLTVAQMNAIDKATMDAGIPSLILMENAAHRVVEYITEHFAPLSKHKIVVVCGKGNNGGDGLAIARILRAPAVVIAEAHEEELKMLHAAGLREQREFPKDATLVVDAILGTGLKGPVKGPALDAIRHINTNYSQAKVVAVDIPSGLNGDSAKPEGEYVRADATITFTAPKICHALPPARHLMGDLRIASIGTQPAMYENDPAINLSLITPKEIASLFAPRDRDSNKGRYGHVLVIAGSKGKPGAAAMASLAALHAGAGLVTVTCPEAAPFSPELMTEPMSRAEELAAKFTLTAIGPGLGTDDETKDLVRRLFRDLDKPMIVDADALNCIADTDWKSNGPPRILTPHPGEMSRLTGKSIPEVQANRIEIARALATERNVTVVLKGEGTVIAFPDGRAWINTTGSPAMATGGTGDILTGLTAGLAAQFPKDLDRATAAAVYLHGLAGETAARHLGEQPVIATDLLRYLPEGIRAITKVSN